MSIKQEGTKKQPKAEKCFMLFVSNFSVYNYQLQTAISPRSLTQIKWNNPW